MFISLCLVCIYVADATVTCLFHLAQWPRSKAPRDSVLAKVTVLPLSNQGDNIVSLLTSDTMVIYCSLSKDINKQINK